MSELFYRHGKEFKGLPYKDSKGAPYTLGRRKCTRCGGAGRSDKWAHTGYTCFDCGGSGDGGERREKLYTAEKLAKLNATAEKRHAKKQAIADAKEAERKIQADAARGKFESENAELLAWLRAATPNYDDFDVAGQSEFLVSLRRQAERSACWSLAQIEALKKFKRTSEERAARAAGSKFVGAVGGKLKDVKVVVERVNDFYRNGFSGGRELVYITQMRDPDGNALVVMSPRFHAEKGEELVISGKIKKHSEFRGERQTELSHVREKAAA